MHSGELKSTLILRKNWKQNSSGNEPTLIRGPMMTIRERKIPNDLFSIVIRKMTRCMWGNKGLTRPIHVA